MLLAQFHLNSTNQPYGPETLVTTALLNEISRICTYDHTPNGVLAELRMGYTIECPSGFYTARDDGLD